ncbi:MAG: hypothetical protein ACE5IR_26175 [bacterium]
MKAVKTFLHLSLIWFVFQSCHGHDSDIVWDPYGRFSSEKITESSSLVKSRRYEDVYWTHNDSGDRARIFAVTARGKLIREVGIIGAKNVDWEDLAVDDAGHLYIGDSGNNRNIRQDLTVYVIPEPDPLTSDSVAVLKRIHFTYPDQKSFPEPGNRNFDCEALFWTNGRLYILTKHRSDRKTKLYRFDTLEHNSSQVLTKVGEFDVDGAVTSADVSMDGSRLLVLCYEYIYLFGKPVSSDNYLAGEYKRILFEGRQSEGICFSGTDFLFSNEQREIFKLPISIFEQRESFIPDLPGLTIPKLADYKLDGLENEWSSHDGMLTISLNKINQTGKKECEAPTVRVARVKDGLLVSVQKWQIPKKKKRVVMHLMIGPNNQRTVDLQPGAFVWKLKKSNKNYHFMSEYPESVAGDFAPQTEIVKSREHISAEILLPISVLNDGGNKPADRILFNIILNPGSACEWYWATDTTMFSYANPYLWGELHSGE